MSGVWFQAQALGFHNSGSGSMIAGRLIDGVEGVSAEKKKRLGGMLWRYWRYWQ